MVGVVVAALKMPCHVNKALNEATMFAAVLLFHAPPCVQPLSLS